MKLIDEKFKIEFGKYEINDFQLMSALVRWSDSYTRQGRLSFHLLKEFLSFSVFVEMDKEIQYYVKSIGLYFRKPLHRIKMEEQAIQEFKDFIFKKFKKARPKIVKWEIKVD